MVEKAFPSGQVVVDIEPQTWHRVPTLIRQGRDQIYDPVLVSLGPYYRGQSRFKKVEDLKAQIVDEVLSSSSDGRQNFQDEIRSGLEGIRRFYGGRGGAADKYGDEELTEMMLRDACFLVYCMKTMTVHQDQKHCIVHHHLGMSRVAFVVRDFFMLENQLPFWIIKTPLVSLTSQDYHQALAAENSDDNDHGNNGCETFFCNLMRSMITGDSDSQQETKTPLHLLDARRTTFLQQKEMMKNSCQVNKDNSSCHCFFKSRDDTKKKEKRKKMTNNPFRSVTDLKAKGIHFRPSSYCLTDIKFCSHSFYGKLRLPILSLDKKTNVIFSNIIALEMCPDSGTDFAVISYVKFMKSLIEKAEDVKELREKSIIMSCLASDEEVVKMFKEFNTDGSCGKDMFREIRERINEHCNSKSKTFKAELIHTYFRSPWTAIALFAAILILCINCLNFILNYYRAHSKTKRD
ncbi:hypothetical protein C2S51_009471 [Perilla frutescens var. frutescens]|nr:hypothetical protein C2S51_009471 [Perilla frutescens var. frutescens]